MISLDEKIAFNAVRLIRKSAMKIERWRATVVGALHRDFARPLADGELALVSASFPEGDGYVWTTRRIMAMTGGCQWEAASDSIHHIEWGHPKGNLADFEKLSEAESTLGLFESRSGLRFPLRYETGYAWMGIVQCHQYWQLKHPILHKLREPEPFPKPDPRSI